MIVPRHVVSWSQSLEASTRCPDCRRRAGDPAQQTDSATLGKDAWWTNTSLVARSMLGFKALKDWFIPFFDGSAPGTLSLSPSQILWPYKGTHFRSSCAHTAQRSVSEASLPLCAALSGQTSPGTALRMGSILQQEGLPLSFGSCPCSGEKCGGLPGDPP